MAPRGSLFSLLVLSLLLYIILPFLLSLSLSFPLSAAQIYLLIQGPAFQTDVSKHERTDQQAKVEHNWALAGLIVCVLSFSAYLWYQVRTPTAAYIEIYKS